MRRVASVVLALLLLGALAGPVAARGHLDVTEVPLGSYDFTVTADVGCGTFDVDVADVSGRIFEIDYGTDRHGTARFATIFNTVTTYTRTDTGASIARPFVSYGHFVTKADGSLSITGIGDTVLYGPPEAPALGLTPEIWILENSTAVFQYDADGNFIRAKRYGGRAFDVCAALR
jgi:hypothetical protein